MSYIHRRTSRANRSLFAVIFALLLILGLTVAVQAAEPVVEVTDGRAGIAPGEATTYTITVTNPGTTTLTMLTLTNTLPSATALITASAGGAESVAGSGIIFWPAFELSAGQVATRTVNARLAFPMSLTVTFVTNTVALDGLVVISTTPPITDTSPITGTPPITNTVPITSTPPATVTAPFTTVTAIDVNSILTAAIGGLLWHDLDGNGQVDFGEPGLSSVTLDIQMSGDDDLFDTHDDLATQATTDQDGFYSLGGLQPGPLRITVNTATLGVGLAPVFDLDGAADNQTVITATAGTLTDQINFGYATLDLSITKRSPDLAVTTDMTVTYQITLTNDSVVTATQVLLAERTPANTRIVTETAAAGWLCPEATLLGSECTLLIGALGPAQSMMVTFTVEVTSVMPLETNIVTNTVYISTTSSGAADPTPLNNSATVTTFVSAAPKLYVVQTDGGIKTEPGRTLVYTITFGNRGNQDTDAVRLVQQVPANTTFARDASSAGWSCPDGSAAGVVCILQIGLLPGKADRLATFSVKLNAAMPVNVATLQGIVTIQDKRGDSAQDSELTPVEAASDLLLLVKPGRDVVKPADTISYTVRYSNTGNQDAIGVILVATVPDYTIFLPSSSSAKWTCSGGVQSGANCSLPIGSLRVGDGGQATFVVTLDENLPPNTETVRLRVVVAGSGLEKNIANNLVNNTVRIQQPTAVVLIGFGVIPEDELLVVQWETAAEVDTKEFNLARSSDGRWENRANVTYDPIPSEGTPTSGGLYQFIDVSVVPNVTYTYWLVETETSGRELAYGPVTGRLRSSSVEDWDGLLPLRLFLPVVVGE